MPANHHSLRLERFLRSSRVEEPCREQCRIKGDCFALHAGVVPSGIVGPNDVGTIEETKNTFQTCENAVVPIIDLLIFLDGSTETADTQGIPGGSHFYVSLTNN